MTAALTPQLALQYLAELQPELAAAAVVAADGTVLAGDGSLGARLAAGGGGSERQAEAGGGGSERLAAAGGGGSERLAGAGGGESERLAGAGGGGSERLLAARSSAHVVIALIGSGALASLVQHDLDMVARELG